MLPGPRARPEAGVTKRQTTTADALGQGTRDIGRADAARQREGTRQAGAGQRTRVATMFVPAPQNRVGPPVAVASSSGVSL